MKRITNINWWHRMLAGRWHRMVLVFGVGAWLTLLTGVALAAVPQLINFQGILRDGSGNPVANGAYSVTFTIYDAPSAGSVLWTETQSVTTNGGLFTVLLGSATPVLDSTFNDSSRYLGITVGADPEMTPRQRLSSVGYSHNSSEWTSAAQDLFRLNGKVGIGTANPQAKLHVSGEAEGLRIQGTGVGNPGGAYASFHDAAGTAMGYVGDGSSGNQDMYVTSYVGGVHLYTPAGAALTAGADGNVGIGTAPFVSTKLWVVTDLSRAIQGRSTNITGIGVAGEATGLGGDGVFGAGNNGSGAGYFLGNVFVQGNLSKSSGSFKIDHPIDPANKYLYHSFVESPDMMNIYNGNATLDSKGEAAIALPDWFGALNKDFRYQLTCIGGFAQVYVAEKVKNNRFKIAGGTAGLEVSWQVTGIRQDAYANAHRIPVEEVKADKERGYYLHPELFGQPEEKGTEWARHPEMMKEMKEQREKAKAESEK